MERIEPEPIELILYVSAQSPQADAAVAKMRGVLARFNSPKVRLTVCPLPGADGRTAAEPMTPKLSARTMILGHITHPEILLEILKDCDLDPPVES